MFSTHALTSNIGPSHHSPTLLLSRWPSLQNQVIQWYLCWCNDINGDMMIPFVTQWNLWWYLLYLWWYNYNYSDTMIPMVIQWYLRWYNDTFRETMKPMVIDTYYTYGDTIITIVIQWSYKDGDTYDQTMMVIPLKPEQ